MEQADFLRYVVGVLEGQGIVYMLVGSVASGAYGEPRFTRDIDIVADLKSSHVSPFIRAFPTENFYVSEQAAQQAVQRRSQFNIIHPASGQKADIIIARQDAWGRSQLARRVRTLLLPDLRGYAASREDVILGKLWYFREGGSEKHLRDVAGIVTASDTPIDHNYVQHWSGELGVREAWATVLARLKTR